MDTKSPQKLPHSPKPTPKVKPVPARLLPAQHPQPAIAGRKEPIWRMIWPKLKPEPLPAADPGLAIMAAVNEIASDLQHHLPSDKQLRRMFQRYGNLLAEGEGTQATEDLRAIDHYVSEQAFGYANLRRKALRQKRVSISKAAAFCVVAFTPDRKARAYINFSLTGRGHEARGAVAFEVPT